MVSENGNGRTVNGMQSKNLQSRDKEKLKGVAKAHITDMFKSILDFVEVGMGDQDKFSALRKKILKVSNNAIRDIERDLDLYYDVKYVSNTEDVISVQRNGKTDK